MNYIAKKIALQEKNILNHADLYLDYNNRIAFHKNRKINLTVKEFDILVLLIMNPKRVFTKEQIYQHIYNDVEIEVDNRVYGLVKNLRKKIEERPEAPRYIQTVRGVGYRFRA